MRPLKLALEGFTAFKDPIEVDFGNLHLFALTGPNGAGKSSFLESILFALFGTTPRIRGKQVKELISHGRSEFRIEFTFQVEGEIFRVQRRYLKKGNPQVRLEAKKGIDDWQTLTDKVESTNRTILGLLKMGYDTFTKSVILPQNLFDQFLKGDKDKRREVLDEILSLRLFESVAALAGEKSRILREYIRQTELQIVELTAKTTTAQVETLQRQLESFKTEQSSLSTRKTELQKKNAELSRLLDLMGYYQKLIEEEKTKQKDLMSLNEKMNLFQPRVLSLVTSQKELSKKLLNLQDSKIELESRDEKYDLLNDSIEKLKELGMRASEKIKISEKLASHEEKTKKFIEEREKFQQELKKLEEELESYRTFNEREKKKNWASLLQNGLLQGENCPVCLQVVDQLPAFTVAHELKDLVPLEILQKELLVKEAKAAGMLAQSNDEMSELQARQEKVSSKINMLESELSLRLGYSPADLLTKSQNEYKLLRENREALKTLRKEEENFRNQIQKLETQLNQEKKESEKFEKEKTTLETILTRLSKDKHEIEEKIKNTGLQYSQEDLRQESLQMKNEFAKIEDRAQFIQRESGKMEQQLKVMEESKIKIKKLTDECDDNRQEEIVYATLHQDLQKNRLPDYLFSTVLNTLLELAGEKFLQFSGGRYQLTLEGTGEIQILDGWNANMPRPIESLSGGELFAASLSLALALSDYLQGRQRIQALFIDEGFGNLDRETRDKVAEILTSLESESKLIGVVTHIEELAELFPQQIRIEKLPEGSRLLRNGDFPSPISSLEDVRRISEVVA